MTYLRALFLAPGVALHELAHQLFCVLTGVRVRKVVYFRMGSPAGFVLHDEPDLYRQVLAVTAGPFLLNSSVSVLFFNLALRRAVSAATSVEFAVVFALTALATSVALQAIPSRIDAGNLVSSSTSHLKQGNPLALAGYPLAALAYLGQVARPIGSEWFYALFMAYLAFRGFLYG